MISIHLYSQRLFMCLWTLYVCKEISRFCLDFLAFFSASLIVRWKYAIFRAKPNRLNQNILRISGVSKTLKTARKALALCRILRKKTAEKTRSFAKINEWSLANTRVKFSKTTRRVRRKDVFGQKNCRFCPDWRKHGNSFCKDNGRKKPFAWDYRQTAKRKIHHKKV